jgi:hypothetical protein
MVSKLCSGRVPFTPAPDDRLDWPGRQLLRSLARWWRAFCAGEIVSQASLTQMAAFCDGEVDYGLGLFNPAQRASIEGVGNLGANFGYKSSAGCLIREGVIVVVLTNQDLDSFGLAIPLVLAALED